MANANRPKAAQVTAAAIEKHLDSRTATHLKMSKFFHVKLNICNGEIKKPVSISNDQSYVIKSAPWTIFWFRILGIFSVENIKRLCVFMFQTCSNSQLLRRVLWISAEQTIGASLKHKNTQPLYIFSRVRVLHLNRLQERTWLHSFDWEFVHPALSSQRVILYSKLKLRNVMKPGFFRAGTLITVAKVFTS